MRCSIPPLSRQQRLLYTMRDTKIRVQIDKDGSNTRAQSGAQVQNTWGGRDVVTVVRYVQGIWNVQKDSSSKESSEHWHMIMRWQGPPRGSSSHTMPGERVRNTGRALKQSASGTDSATTHPRWASSHDRSRRSASRRSFPPRWRSRA